VSARPFRKRRPIERRIIVLEKFWDAGKSFEVFHRERIFARDDDRRINITTE
jgi:hypothetical protein